MIIRKITGIVVLLLPLCGTIVSGQSAAHKRSGFAIIDPAYSIDKKNPASNLLANAASWIYGPGELECWRLQLLMQRKDSAKLNVGYPGIFHIPYDTASFRLKLQEQVGVDPLKFKATGHGKVYVNGKFLADFIETDSYTSISTVPGITIREIRFDIITSNEPAALLIEDKKISTSNNSWEWNAGADNWQPACHYPKNIPGVPPHKLEDPTVILKPVSVENGLYDFGRELLGYVMIRKTSKPILSVGESTAEALDVNNKALEQTMEMVEAENGLWISKVPLAFRYLYTDVNQEDAVQCKAIFHPLAYRGAFACSDSILTRVWMNSAYTLRLCMHDFILDGIKRDRLPWAGDLAMSMVANAYTFSDPEMVRRSLVALGQAGVKEKDINGIIDYSLWWIISQDHYQLYFADTLHLKYEWGRIKETLDLLATRCDDSGFLIPKNTWLFVDWVDQEKWSALQILWWWAQESGARLAHRVGDLQTESRLKTNCENLKIRLLQTIWSEKEKV
ncbi:MAG: hypothetical protein V2A67_10575 [Bacteroidota bacterium]